MMRSGESQAVFLSYASQDAEAARRICEALHAAGVEVWFDQSELRGGDAWDAKIRKQIATCDLFLPVISASTESRLEGYFRIEWKLAAQRTHAMADEKAFLLPVVIDDTRDADAKVPAEFRSVQWMRLPAGETSPTFCERVRSLLNDQVEPAVPSGLSIDRGQTSPMRTAGSTRTRPVKGLVSVLLAGVAAIVACAIWQPWKSSTPPAPPGETQSVKSVDPSADKSIAVLPFENRSDDQEANAFFAEGMHDELLAALAKIGELKVIARSSVLAYRDPAQRNLRQIATELGVSHILEGSVSRAGNKVRIIVQLVEAASGRQKWAETYQSELTDIFQLQADLAAKIASSLATTISPGQRRALAQKITERPEAYDLYLRARNRWDGEGRSFAGRRLYVDDWEKTVIGPLEQAVKLDPRFATAYAELGRVHTELYWWEHLDPTPQRLAKAKEAIDTALRLDPELPVAHLALGTYYYRGFLDYPRATEEFAIALAAMPGDAEVLFGLSSTQRRQGRWAEATANMERAFSVNPQDRTYGAAWVGNLISRHLYRQALKAADRVLAIRPNDTRLILAKAEARFALDGDADRYRAVHAATEVPNVDPRRTQSAQAFLAGRYAEVVRIADESDQSFEEGPRQSSEVGNRYYFSAFAIGAPEKARARARAEIAAIKARPAERRDSWVPVARLAMAQAYAGMAEEARQHAERVLDMMPVKRDAVSGPRALNMIARVYLALGDHDRALALLDQALSVPDGGSANEILHFEPWWKPLHNDPRFKAALAKAAPKE